MGAKSKNPCALFAIKPMNFDDIIVPPPPLVVPQPEYSATEKELYKEIFNSGVGNIIATEYLQGKITFSQYLTKEAEIYPHVTESRVYSTKQFL